MDQNQPLRNNKIVKGSTYLPARSLASLANRRKQHPILVSQVQTQVHQVPLISTSPVEQVQEQVSFICTSPVELVGDQV